jgi:nitric oxide reductase subunit B
MGVITAHYGVEGGAFYGIPLDTILPYVVSRTWHLQLGIFWIATAWLAAGLYIGPSVGIEPRFQRLGVNVLCSGRNLPSIRRPCASRERQCSSSG